MIVRFKDNPDYPSASALSGFVAYFEGTKSEDYDLIG